MDLPPASFELLSTTCWWLGALVSPCLLALIPRGSAQKGGRP